MWKGGCFMQNYDENINQNNEEYNNVIIDKSTENKIFGKTFFWMFLGLLGSAIVAAYTYYSGLIVNIVVGGSWGALLVLELAVVIIFSLCFRKISPTAVGILYFLYSMINGVTLCTIFAVYELNSIISLFVVSALIFAALGYIGYKTDKDLSSWGTYITVFLIAGLIISVLNLFIFKSTGLDLILDWIILAVFFGVTVYDTNKIKVLENDPSIDTNKVHIYCAMQLYLDFINIFLRILSIFGKRRD